MHRLLAAVALIAIALAVGAAAAQDGRRVMIMESDDGAPPIVHMSSIDTMRLRKPDFVRADVPLFRRVLGLDDVQALWVQARIDAYLEAFHALCVKHLGPATPQVAFGPGPMLHPEGNEIAEGEGGDDGPMHWAFGEGEGVDIDLDELGDGAFAIAITADTRMGGEAEGGGGGAPMADPEIDGEGVALAVTATAGGDTDDAPESGVSIAIAAPEGVEIPEEIQQQLAEAAERLAAQMQERAERDAEAGLAPGEGMRPPFGPDLEELEALDEAAEALRLAKEELRRDFIADVQAQLDLAQMERWPALERALVRVKTLPDGRLDGERTDLLALLEEMELDEADHASIAAIALDYEIALHDALVRRNEFLFDANQRIDAAVGAGEMDRAARIADRAARLRVAVRDVNDRYVDALAGALDEAGAAALRDRADRAAHPRLYARTRTVRAFEQARAIEALDEATLAAVDDLEQAYETELASVRDHIRTVVRRHQPDEPKRMFEHLANPTGGPPPGLDRDDPVNTAWRERRELDKRYLERLRTLVGDAHAESLPKPTDGTPLIIRRVGG